MMRWLMIGFAVLCALWSVPARADWIEARHPRFVIYGNMAPAKLQAFAEKVARFDAAIRLIATPEERAADAADRVTLYLVSDEYEVQRLYGKGGSRNVAGFYVPRYSGSIAVMPANVSDGDEYFDANFVLFHEYTHHVTLSSVAGFYPRWLSEGYAEFFATARIGRDGSVVLGSPNNARGYSIMTDTPIAMRELLNSDRMKPNDSRTDEVYARGWLLTHYLLVGRKRPAAQLNLYVNLVNQGVPSVEAGTQAFGDLRKLDSELNSYRQSPSFNGVRLKPEALKVEPVTLRPLSAGEAAMMKLRIRSDRGVDEKEAAALVEPARAAAAPYPNQPWVQRVLAEIEYDAGNLDAAEAACDRALAADPKMVAALLYKGRIRARRALDAKDFSVATWKAVRDWYLQANRVDTDLPAAFVLYYQSFLISNQTPSKSAGQGIQRALMLVPQDSGVRWLVVRALLAEGDVATARAVLRPLAFAPHGSSEAAQALLARLDAGLTPEQARQLTLSDMGGGDAD